jgi:P27 family predicted phage terminase small subunit
MPNYPKPTALKKLEGNPGKRALNKNEPNFSGTPKCPASLTPAAKKEWKRVVAELESLDMLRSVDTSTLAVYCQSFARWLSAEAMIEKEGQVIKEPILNKNFEVVGERVKKHPAVTVAKEAMASMMAASSRFGFDPSSRTRLSVGEGSKQDPFEAFMKSIEADETIPS